MINETMLFLCYGEGTLKKKGSIVDTSRHCVIQSAHPSPLSGSKWFGCKVFSKANDYFKTKNISPVNWSVICSPASSHIMNPISPVQIQLPSFSVIPTWKCACCETVSSDSVNICPVCLVPRLNPQSPPKPNVVSNPSTSLFPPLPSENSITQPPRGLGFTPKVKPKCPYGDKCFRQNPEHSQLFDHPNVIPDLEVNNLLAQVVTPSLATLPSITFPQTTPVVQQTVNTAIESADSSTSGGVSRMGKLLFLIAHLYREGSIDYETRNKLKDLAIEKNKRIFYALEAFEADEDKDITELNHTFHRIILR